MKISIVGCGKGGAKLIRLFQAMESVEIVSVVDQNLQCQGMTLAQNLKIQTLTDLRQISDNVEMIIEATGNKGVQDKLHALYPTKKIVESDVAKLMMQMVDKQIEASEKLNVQLNKMNEISQELYSQMNDLISGTQAINQINSLLGQSSEESKNYIVQTDEMVSAINKITQQIKILGLNANIEAARAGEHGKGFAVVATEVQKMSDSTSAFAARISGLLQSLSEENKKITTNIEVLAGHSKEQEGLSSKLEEIVKSLKTV